MKKDRFETLKETRERRKHQKCSVYEIKIDKSHLSKEKHEYLKKAFLEAKWLYNYLLATNDIKNASTKCKEVIVLNKDKEEEIRYLENISSQMKQGILERIISSTKMLKTKIERGRENEVGRLKFKSEYNSIPLKQFGVTYKIINDKYIKLQGFKKPFRVIGLKQIPEDAEIANANLVRIAGDYYFKITCFTKKEERVKTNKKIGLDFGIMDNITTSNGDKINISVPESKGIKKASKKMNKAKKGSKNRFKRKIKLRKEYKKNSNKKKDIANKVVSKLKRENDMICIQDESIHEWHQEKTKGYSKVVQYSAMGGIIAELKQHSATLVIDKYFCSTKKCRNCGKLNDISTKVRTYSCDCGYSFDRDVHAALNILEEGIRICTERTNKMPVGAVTKGDCVDAGSLYALA